MTAYALVSPQGVVDRYDDKVDPNTGTKPGWKWLPVEQEATPAFDSKTQVCEPVAVVAAARVLRTWSVRDKTSEELDATKGFEMSRVNKATLEVTFNHENRIRALEGKNAVTKAQFINAVKGLL